METDRTTRHILEGRELIDYLVEKSSSSAMQNCCTVKTAAIVA